MSSAMMLRGIGARPCVAARIRPGTTIRPVARPSPRHSQFTSACNKLTSLTSSFAGCSLSSPQRLPVRSRHTFLIQAKNHGSQACTLQGSRKRRTRTSGFRARRLTVGGRRVLKNRRKKGRHVLCPANNANRKART